MCWKCLKKLRSAKAQMLLRLTGVRARQAGKGVNKMTMKNGKDYNKMFVITGKGFNKMKIDIGTVWIFIAGSLWGSIGLFIRWMSDAAKTESTFVTFFCVTHPESVVPSYILFAFIRFLQSYIRLSTL